MIWVFMLKIKESSILYLKKETKSAVLQLNEDLWSVLYYQ